MQRTSRFERGVSATASHCCHSRTPTSACPGALANTMRRRDFIKLMAGSAAAWQLAAMAALDRPAMAANAVTAPCAVLVYSSLGACNGVVLGRTWC